MTRALDPYPAYRDSGLPWLGEIPEHWEVRRNGRLFVQRNETGYADLPILEVSLRTGVRVRQFDKGDRKQKMTDRSQYKRAARGDVAYNMMRMWQGAVGVAPMDGLVSPAYVVACPFPGIDSRYYSYLFRTGDYMREIDSLSRGIVSDRNRLYWDDFKQLPAVFPPFNEQVKIADFLDGHQCLTNRLIHNKERLIALLKERKQAMIDRAITRGLDPNAPMKPTGMDWMPEAPAHWEVRRLGQMGRLSKGNGGSKEDEAPVGIPCVRYGDLYTTHSYFIEKTRSFVGEEISKNYTPIVFGDVLFAASGETIEEIGKSAVNLMRTTACCGGDVILFRPEGDAVARYMGYALGCRSSAAQKATMGRGMTVMHIYAGQLKRLLVPLPPVSEQAAIVERLDRSVAAIDAAIGRARRQIDLLREYRERLINDVVTGKLDVREARVAASPDADAPQESGQAPSHRAEAGAPAIP